MFCSNCAKDLSTLGPAKFCPSCGHGLDQELTRESTVRVIREPLLQSLRQKIARRFQSLFVAILPKFRTLNYRKILVICGSIIGVCGIAIGGTLYGVDTYQITAQDKVNLNAVLGDSEAEKLAAGLCPTAAHFIISDYENIIYLEQLKKLQDVSKSSNLRSILRYQKQNSWTNETLPSPKDVLMGEASRKLKVALNQNDRIMPEAFNYVLSVITPELVELALLKCELQKKFSSAVEFAATYNQAQDIFATKANSAPWYPDGYFERFDGANRLAFKWVNRANDCYSCYQWDLNVITRDGCYGGVYAKINIEKSTSVIDWTNDNLASLAPGQVGQMRFKSYLEGYGTLSASLVEISCYD